MLAPLLSLLVAAAGGSDFWSEIGPYLLPRALRDTALLLVGVGIVVVAVGVGSAWLVATFEFPGRRVIEPALVLPLAVPTYVVAFAYLDLLHPVGPVQTGLRRLLGYGRPQDLAWFPEIRSPWMCALLLGFVLYPYVYLPTRALLLGRCAELADAASSLGARPSRVLARISLPLAKPAVVAGTSLALLETMNDVGAAEFLGVRTLTVSAYATWVNRSDLAGAAQLSLLALLVVAALLATGRWSGRGRETASGGRSPDRRRLRGGAAVAAVALTGLPVLVGFAAPAGHLALETARRIAGPGLSSALLAEAVATVGLSALATAATMALALVLACGLRLAPSRPGALMTVVATLGYGVPATLLAVGFLVPFAAVDSALNGLSRALLGSEPGLVLLGSSAGLVLVYVIRFLAIGIGTAEAGLSRIPLAWDDAARGLGARAPALVRRIHLPLIGPAVASGAVLVFVDCMKELPATLLLRPLNVETLATHVYGEAARGTYEEGAAAALLIVLIGLVPLLLLLRVGRPP